jgi:hypothetical protein
MIWTSFALSMVLSLAQVYYHTQMGPALVVGAMEAVLLLIYASSQRTGQLLRQRMIGDGVFLLPALYLIW